MEGAALAMSAMALGVSLGLTILVYLVLRTVLPTGRPQRAPEPPGVSVSRIVAPDHPVFRPRNPRESD